jgi:ATP-binding cassette, subfamily B, bacterial CvaB/MchF/RaxB
LQSEAQEETAFLETIRAMQAIKLNNLEGQRHNRWQSAAIATLNSEIRGGTVRLWAEGAKKLILRLGDIIVIFLAASLTLSSQITLGTIFAFLLYKSTFIQRFSALIQNLISISLLKSNVERIADIALSKTETLSGSAAITEDEYELTGSVSIKDVHFRYGIGDAAILSGVTLEIDAGDFVAITGPSGGGKSTLVKLMLGLLTPIAGSVAFDNKRMSYWGLERLRRTIGAVMQDDVLLAGSIKDNICSFAEHCDFEWLKECAKLAMIDLEIEAMPMGYNTVVGDLGTSFSGGQRARLFLARALYRKPKIIVIDEGSANIDLKTEAAINETLQRLKITKIVVAHRPQTIEAASKVWTIQNGKAFLTVAGRQ